MNIDEEKKTSEANKMMNSFPPIKTISQLVQFFRRNSSPKNIFFSNKNFVLKIIKKFSHLLKMSLVVSLFPKPF
jgi:hypothetical protein